MQVWGGGGGFLSMPPSRLRLAFTIRIYALCMTLVWPSFPQVQWQRGVSFTLGIRERRAFCSFYIYRITPHLRYLPTRWHYSCCIFRFVAFY